MKVSLIYWLVAGAIAALIALTACTTALPASLPGAAPEAAVALERITVERGSIENHVTANGRVVADRTAALTFNRGGRIAQVNAREGEWVQQGQLLAKLDTRELELIAKQQHANYIGALAQYSQTLRGGLPADIRQAQSEFASASQRLKDLDKGPAQAQVAELQAQVADLQGQMQQAEAEVKLAQAAYDTVRRENPAGAGGTPEAATLEIKTIALQAANARLQAAQARLEAAYEKPNPGQYAELRAQMAAAQARLNALRPVSETIVSAQALADQAYYAWQQAELALRDTRIIAPFDGLVTNVAMAMGDAASSSSVIQLADFSEPIFEAEVDEADLAKIKIDQDARVRLQTYIDTPISAIVKGIGKVGRQNGSLIVYRVQLALGAFEQPDESSAAEPDEQAAAQPEEQPTAEPDEQTAAQPAEQSAEEPAESAEPATEEKPEILLNMSGSVQFVTAISEDALLVPAQALIQDPDTRTYSVQIVKGEGDAAQTEEVEVEIGLRNSEMVEIISGVNEGDTLLVPEPDNIPLEGPSVN